MKNGKLKRSAVLLFYHDPGIVQVGSYIKIGRFGEGADLQYHDDLEGSLIKNADQVIDLIYLKYLKAKVEYIHDRRVETYIRILQMLSTGQGILSIGAEELKRYLMNARPWVLSNRTMNFLDMVFVSFSRHLRVLL